MTDPVALLSEYLRIDTSNPPGDCRGAAELLCGALRAEGLSPVTFGATPEKPNVLCHVGGTEEPGLVLIHHMDVVPAKAEEWSVPPFSAQIRDGFLYGRGTLDTKGLGVAHWCAALRAAQAGILRRKLFLVANADEEVGGGEGAEYFVRNLPFPIGAAFGMNEGGVGVTDIFGGGGKFFLLNMWEKGPVWMKLSAAGRAGHGSRPSAKDAPARLARAMARVAEHREPARLDGAGPGHAAGAAREGVRRPRRGRLAGRGGGGGGAGGPRAPVPRDRPAAAEHVRGDDAHGGVQAERDPVVGGGDDRRADRAGRGAGGRGGAGAGPGGRSRRVGRDPLRGEAERVADGAALRGDGGGGPRRAPRRGRRAVHVHRLHRLALLPVDRHPHVRADAGAAPARRAREDPRRGRADPGGRDRGDDADRLQAHRRMER